MKKLRNVLVLALAFAPVSYTHLDVYKRQALSQALTVRNDVRWKPMNGSWQVSEEGLAVQTPGVYAEILSRNEVPETAELKFTFSFTEGTQRVGLALQVDEDFANGYYFYFDPKRQRVEFKRCV